MGEILWRATVITHRYAGVAVGLLMLVWFLSGIVMMYVPYPGVSSGDRLRFASSIPWEACCALDSQPYRDNEPIRSVRIASVAGEPVLRLRPEGQSEWLTSLSPSAAPFAIDERRARAVALESASRTLGPDARLIAEELIERDQWTVGEAGAGHRPLFRYRFDDPERTTLYVSSRTGEVVQWTTAPQRFWNWLGAIPHWLYFTELRARVRLWSEIVIWTSIAGGFLVVLGLYLGIAQVRRRPNGRFSPYRGWFYWHHVTGLVFGVVTLTWVISGTFSMTPFGLFVSKAGNEEVRLAGEPLPWSAFRQSLARVAQSPPSGDVVALDSAPLEGRLFWIATRRDGTVERLDAEGKKTLLSPSELAAAAQRLAGGSAIASAALIAEEDAYHFEFQGFADRDPLLLPVYRVILDDADQTRYYLDPRTGALLNRVDAPSRGYRWFFSGLHRFDFTAWLRARPLWDLVVLALMLGGLAVTATGTYLAWLRLKRDLTFGRRA